MKHWLLVAALLAGCGGPPAIRYLVEPHAVDTETHTVYWYEHSSGHGIGSLPGDDAPHVVMCNERVTPPCVRMNIENIDDTQRHLIMERFSAARGEGSTLAPAPTPPRTPPIGGSTDDWSHQ